MRKLLIFSLALLGTRIFADEVGVRISDVIASHNYQYLKAMNYGLPAFKDVRFGILSYSSELTPPALLCSIVDGKVGVVYGALYGSPPNAYFMIDTNGDGVLDYKAPDNYQPNWVLFSLPMKRTEPSEFLSKCNDLYSQFNSMNGPDQAKAQKFLTDIADTVRNQNAANRDLYYSLLSYTYNTKDPVIAFGIILSLSQNIATRYNNSTSPLFLLYSGESLMNLGNPEGAKKMFSLLKEIDKNSIIAEYYLSRLNDQIAGTNDNIKNFKNKFPVFWTTK